METRNPFVYLPVDDMMSLAALVPIQTAAVWILQFQVEKEVWVVEVHNYPIWDELKYA